MLNVSKSMRAIAAATILSTALSGCAAFFDNQGGLPDEIADSVFHADSKQMRALRGTVAMSVLGNLAIQRHHASDDEVLAAYSQIIAAARPLGVAYAMARSADCGDTKTLVNGAPLTCTDDQRFTPAFDQAMAEATGPILSLAVTGLPNSDGSKLLGAVADQNIAGALVQIWNLVVDSVRSGRRLVAGYRDGIDMQAAILSTELAATTEPADNPHTRLQAAYSSQGGNLKDIRALVTQMAETPAIAAKMRMLRPDPKWIVSSFVLLERACAQHRIAQRISQSALGKSWQIKTDTACQQPQIAFREAYIAALGLDPTKNSASDTDTALFGKHLK